MSPAAATAHTASVVSSSFRDLDSNRPVLTQLAVNQASARYVNGQKPGPLDEGPTAPTRTNEGPRRPLSRWLRRAINRRSFFLMSLVLLAALAVGALALGGLSPKSAGPIAAPTVHPAAPAAPGPSSTAGSAAPSPSDAPRPPDPPAQRSAANPGIAPAPHDAVPAPEASPATDVYYKNCGQVRKAGKAPLYRGQPGYSSQLDPDGDGVACAKGKDKDK